MNWILFGFKRAGKTYFGSQLSLPFIDTDQLIEQRENLSIREIVLQKGEKEFREIEKYVIQQLDVKGHVIAVGGGSVLNPENLTHLQTLGTFIYLDCPKELLKKRMLECPIPTFLNSENPLSSFEQHYIERIKTYEKIPAFRISLEGKSEIQIIEELWQVINLETFLESPPGENLTERQLE